LAFTEDDTTRGVRASSMSVDPTFSIHGDEQTGVFGG
jgi:hypothetical protein